LERLNQAFIRVKYAVFGWNGATTPPACSAELMFVVNIPKWYRCLFLDTVPTTLVPRENHSNLCGENWRCADSCAWTCQF
jgi:hypothetical protein